MDDFTFYFGNGWNHIISVEALDHLLFLIALTVAYSFSNWKQMVVLVTAFTIGHCITLGLSSFDIIRFNTRWVEFLIPCTIILTCLFNIFKGSGKQPDIFQYVVALLFGLIHGMGFANTLRFMLAREQDLFIPLLGFNVAIEVAQVCIVLVLLTLHYIAIKILLLPARWWTIILSTGAGLVAAYLAITRWPL